MFRKFYVIIDKTLDKPRHDSRAWYRFGETVGPVIHYILMFGGGVFVGLVVKSVIVGVLRGLGVI